MSPLTSVQSPDATANRWLAMGHSGDADPTRAGADAARQALQKEDPRLLLVFCSQGYDLEALLAGNGESGGVPLVGCSTAGEIATNRPAEASVVVVALSRSPGPGA